MYAKGLGWVVLLLLVACTPENQAKPSHQSAVQTLGQTPGGAVYHAGHCVADDDQGRLVTFAPGTGVTPQRSKQYVQHLGDATGLCVIAVGYENRELVARCCTTTDTPDGVQDPECLDRVLGAKAAADPPGMACTDGSQLAVPHARSVEGAILEAITYLGMRNYLAADERDVQWDRLVLTGHSQGAQLSLYIALKRHVVAGVGSLGGGVLRTVGPRPFPAFVYDARTTDPGLFKAFHHANDSDSFRREVYDAIGFSPEKIRSTGYESPECEKKPHSCVVVDSVIPMREGTPVFLEDWQWLVAPGD